MTGVTELARKLKKQENFAPYSPMIGKITALPDLQIQCGSKAILDKSDIQATFDIYETIEHKGYTEYVNLNKSVVLLPCYDVNGNPTKFIAVGVVA